MFRLLPALTLIILLVFGQPVSAQVTPTPEAPTAAPATATPAAPTAAPATATPAAPTATLYPTPAPLSAGAVMPAMQSIAGSATALSSTPTGMLVLALFAFVGIFELLWIFVARRRSS